MEALATVVTTDLVAVTRGRSVVGRKLYNVSRGGVGWVPANLSLTPFGGIVADNPWGSSGDLRLIPDLNARFQTGLTGTKTAFDMVMGDLTELEGTPWAGCTRSLLKSALADLRRLTGLTITAAVEQEFQLVGANSASAHPFSLSAMRHTDPFAPTLMAALEDAGVAPEVILAEYGRDQFEVTHAPCDALTAADRAVAIREITREVARTFNWHASFSPKTAPDGVGNGVHIHFSFMDAAGKPATYDPSRPGGLGEQAGRFCAGILRHLPGMLAFTASSVPSYYRLKPHSWSSAYTWLGDRDREASLRICPMTSLGGDPAKQFNVEYRAADATGNPYLQLMTLIRAGLEGLSKSLPAPVIFIGDPETLTPADRAEKGLVRLPETLTAAIEKLEGDQTVRGWFSPALINTFIGIKQHEVAHLSDCDPDKICNIYKALY
ncbi:MAG: glutamine synthetase [Mesorhizobium sp.]